MTVRLPWPTTVTVKKEPALWAVAGLLSFLLFLLLTFPFGALQSRILLEMGRVTGWEVRAAEWSVSLPIGVEWRDLVLTKPNAASIPIDTMRMGIGLLAQLAGRHTVDAMIHFPGSAQSGAARATGTLTVSSWSFQGPISVKSRAQQVDLALLFKPYIAKGFLQADVAHAWVGHPDARVTFKGEGSWKAEIKDLVLERIPLGPAVLPSLAFSRVVLSVVCHDAQCDVTEFKGEGPDGSVTGQGRFLLEQPLQRTALELTLTVQAGSGWAQKSAGLPLSPLSPGAPLTFKLVGSVANPRLSV